MQLAFGNGKTFINLLICHYVAKILGEKVVYVTLYSSLKRDVVDKYRKVGATGFEVIEEADLF